MAPDTEFQLRLIWEEETAVAVNPVGLAGVVHASWVFALTQVVNPETQVELF